MKKEGQSKISDIPCLGILCGKTIELPSYIGNEQYDGEFRCQECQSLLRICLRKGTVLKYSLKADESKATRASERLKKITDRLKPHNTE